jgi:hypothetical protein
MSVPYPDFDPSKMQNPMNANPEGSTSSIPEEKKDMPYNGIHNVRMEYNHMTVQLNFNTVNDIYIYQCPASDYSPGYHPSSTRSGTPTGPPPPPGVPRSASTEPYKKSPPSVGPVGSTKPVDINLNIRQPSGIVGYSQSNKPIIITPSPPSVMQQGRLVSFEAKSPIDQPPETVRASSVSSTDSKESTDSTSSQRESFPTSIGFPLPPGLPGLPGLPPPPGGISHSPARPPSVPTHSTQRVTYKRLPELDDILYENSK